MMGFETETTARTGTGSLGACAPHANGPRIYVACLASYNNGCLFGRWIDVGEDEATLRSEVAAMLRASPEPHAEEHAIHDFENFEGCEVREYESLSHVVALAQFAVEHGTLGGQVLNYYGGDLDDARCAMEDRYAGTYTSLEDFADEICSEHFASVHESMRGYIDYEAIGRDMALSGDIITFELAHDDIRIFWAGYSQPSPKPINTVLKGFQSWTCAISQLKT